MLERLHPSEYNQGLPEEEQITPENLRDRLLLAIREEATKGNQLKIVIMKWVTENLLAGGGLGAAFKVVQFVFRNLDSLAGIFRSFGEALTQTTRSGVAGKVLKGLRDATRFLVRFIAHAAKADALVGLLRAAVRPVQQTVGGLISRLLLWLRTGRRALIGPVTVGNKTLWVEPNGDIMIEASRWQRFPAFLTLLPQAQRQRLEPPYNTLRGTVDQIILRSGCVDVSCSGNTRTRWRV